MDKSFSDYINQIFVLAIISFMGYGSCLAQVDLKKTDILVLPENPQQQDFISIEDTNKIQPKNANSGASQDSVVAELVDNSVSLWWQKTPLRNSKVGRAADSVEKKLNAEVKIVDSENKNIEHKMTFEILAAQALAKFEYFGWFKAAVNYDIKNATTEAEILEKLNIDKDLVISHTLTSTENKSQLSLRWSW